MSQEYKHRVLPSPEKMSTPHLALSNIPTDLVEQYRDYYGSDNLIALIGYGSYWNKLATATSIPDAFGVVRDIAAFHSRNFRKNPEIYGPGGIRVHQGYDRTGLTYYRPTFDIDGREMKVKAPVISLDSFNSLGRGGVVDGQVTRPLNPYDLHLEGKLAKYALVPLEPKELDPELSKTINQARLNYFALSLYRLPGLFTRNQGLNAYVRLSYDIDPRPEPADKVQKMIQANSDGYDELYDLLLQTYADFGVVRVAEDSVLRLIELNNKDKVEKLFGQSVARGFVQNYWRNLLSGNPVDGLNYGVMKALRAIKMDHKVVKSAA